MERERRVLQIPVGEGKWATLDAWWPITEEAWVLMIGVMQAMKPGVVRPAPAPPPAD